MPAFALSLLSTFSIGFLIAAWAPNERAATMIANLFYFPMIFLSGATIPLEMFPDSLQTAAKLLPLTWAIKLLRATWIESVDLNRTGVFVLVATLLVCSTLAVRFFRWD
ncbi:MAG: ABC transporter permease [Acidimicrobiaceae bacterium]|nr:ABC transporter permease [Acidimicrobiaceae bacterium]